MSTRTSLKELHTTPPGSFMKTPPGSLIKVPLTPPPSEQKFGHSAQRITQEIEARKSGRGPIPGPWLRYYLPPTEYSDLKQRLDKDSFVIDKQRFDYFPSASLFVLRMPSTLHERFIAHVAKDVIRQLDSIANGTGLASELAGHIEQGRSSKITFSDPAYGPHEPDDMFCYEQASFPNVVFEISYSQKRKDLGRLADDYILGSNGNIHVVVAIDIDYKDKSATLSMWRPRRQVNSAGERELVAYQTISNQEIRTASGEVSSQEGLRLQLEDFVPSPLLPKDTNLDRDIFISSADLCNYLRRAERATLSFKHNAGIEEPLEPGLKKRSRLNTDYTDS